MSDELSDLTESVLNEVRSFFSSQPWSRILEIDFVLFSLEKFYCVEERVLGPSQANFSGCGWIGPFGGERHRLSGPAFEGTRKDSKPFCWRSGATGDKHAGHHRCAGQRVHRLGERNGNSGASSNSATVRDSARITECFWRSAGAIRAADSFVASDVVVGVLEALQLRCLAVEFALFDETAADPRLVVVTKLDLICETQARDVVVCEIKIRPTVSTAQSWNDPAALLQLACGGFLLTRATLLPVRHLLLVEVFRECVDTQLRDEILLTSFTPGPSWAQAAESVFPCTEG
jgi:hypothetical protein